MLGRTQLLIDLMNSDIPPKDKNELVQVALKQASKEEKANLNLNLALFHAAEKGCTEIGEMLLSKGADRDFRAFDSYVHDKTLLMAAAARGKIEFVKMLFGSNQSLAVDKENSLGQTALWYAAYYAKTNPNDSDGKAVVKFLLLKGAKPVIDYLYDGRIKMTTTVNPKDYLSEVELGEYLSQKEFKATSAQPSQIGAFGSRSISPTRSVNPDQPSHQATVAVVLPESSSPGLRQN